MTVPQINRGSAQPPPAGAPSGSELSESHPDQESKSVSAPHGFSKHAGNATSRRRILVAEDDDEMRALLTWRLANAGFEVAECNHGIDLINRIDPIGELVPPESFDLIISDVRMPGITGLEVLDDVQRCGTKCPPVILITAFGDQETHRQAHKLGAAAMFDKPFDIGELLTKVDELIPPSNS